LESKERDWIPKGRTGNQGERLESKERDWIPNGRTRNHAEKLESKGTRNQRE
jgi:hypothetical protein